METLSDYALEVLESYLLRAKPTKPENVVLPDPLTGFSLQIRIQPQRNGYVIKYGNVQLMAKFVQGRLKVVKYAWEDS